MIHLEYERKFREGNVEVMRYSLNGLPIGIYEGSVEIVNGGAQYSGTKAYYARVHLLTAERDLLTLTTTSQGEWLTKDECMDRVRRFLNQVDKWEMIDEWENSK